jgi:hypothetical protein
MAYLLMLAPADAAIPPGKAQQTADLAGVPIQVFTYRPPDCAITGAVLVFHGLNRNADGYRDHAIPLANRLCRLVAAPLFDTTRFPTWRYQRGGIQHDGALIPPPDRTVALVAPLAAWVRQQEARPDLPYALIGHSAGGQFLSRVAAYTATQATSIVIANPSTWVRASPDIAVPYGFQGFDDPAALQRYLAAPVTVLLGQDDTGSHNLVTGKQAEDQGATRLARGQTVFQEAKQTAEAHGWPFGWTIAFVADTGHDAARMFDSAQATQALLK